MNNDNQVIEIDLLEVLKVLWNKAITIIFAAVIGGALALGCTYYLIPPKYEADCMFYVNNNTFSVGATNFSITSQDISAAQSLVDTYIVILKSRSTMNEVIKTAGLDMKFEDVSGLISASAVNGTEVFKVTVTTTSPDLSTKIANTIATVLPEKVTEIIEGSSVRIVDYAVLPTVKSSPSYSKNGAIGILIGGLIAAGIVFLMYMFNDVVRSDDYLTKNYDIPILVVVPDLSAGNGKPYYKKYLYGKRQGYGYGRKYGYGYGKKSGYNNSYGYETKVEETNKEPMSEAVLERNRLCRHLSFAASESYKLLRANLFFTIPSDQSNVIGVTSAERAEGKSTTSVNLAYTVAEAGKKVLLIDADMRIPSIAKKLDIKKSPGLSNLIVGQEEINNCIYPSGEFSNWDVMPAGTIPPNPAELLSSDHFTELLDQLKENYDLIIVDLPPVNLVSDAVSVISEITGLLFVVRLGLSSRSAIKTAISKLAFLNSRILGFVFTDADEELVSRGLVARGSNYKKYYKRNYYTKYEYKNEYKDESNN